MNPGLDSLTSLASGSLVQSVDWVAIAPPLVVACTALAVLLADLWLTGPRKVWLPWLALAGLGGAMLALVPLRHADRATFCAPGGGGCSYAVTHLALVLQLVLLASAAVVVLLSMPMTAPRPWADERPLESGLPGGEYHFLLLSSVAGAVVLAGARDLLTLTVALETLSLPAFALVALRRDARAGEAALKYFLMSVASTAVMLFGVSLLYAAAGSLQLDRLAAGLTHVDPRLHTLASIGAVLTLVGFAFKVAAVPFHFWAPDTYRGAPVPVAAYLSVVSKTAAFAGLLLVAGVGLRPYAHVWGPVLAVLAALTMTVGNLVALRQTDAVRLLAWSSIAQSGYVLVPFGTAAGQGGDLVHRLPASVAYLAVYAVMNLGAFAVVTTVGRDRPAGLIADYRGLGRSRPLVAACLAFFLLCLAGLPPGLMGLFGKVAVFQAVVGGGNGWLAVVTAVNVVIALYYYLTWAALLFAPVGGDEGARVRVPTPLGLAIGVTAGVGVVLSVAPQLVLHVLTSSDLLGRG